MELNYLYTEILKIKRPCIHLIMGQSETINSCKVCDKPLCSECDEIKILYYGVDRTYKIHKSCSSSSNRICYSCDNIIPSNEKTYINNDLFYCGYCIRDLREYTFSNLHDCQICNRDINDENRRCTKCKEFICRHCERAYTFSNGNTVCECCKFDRNGFMNYK